MKKKEPDWDEDSLDRYLRLLTHSLRWTRKDGSQAMQFGAAAAWRAELFDAALSLAGGREELAVAALALPNGSNPGRQALRGLPQPAYESDEARMAVLRGSWSAGSDRLAVDYRNDTICMELQSGRDVLWSGPWSLRVSFDGQPAETSGPWKSVCWFSDEDADYLELEAPLTGDCIVQRQILLARKERFLLLADGILGSAAQRIDYTATLPLRPGITFTPAEESCEGWLAGSKRRAAVLPLALPEWRADARGGVLDWTEEGLRLRQSAVGGSLFAPLFFDLAPSRLEEPLTWRTLTVAESRIPAGRGQAAAYRVQVGERQWVVYRSMNGKVNRSFLGVNVASEFFCGRFTKRGVAKPLLEVE